MEDREKGDKQKQWPFCEQVGAYGGVRGRALVWLRCDGEGVSVESEERSGIRD